MNSIPEIDSQSLAAMVNSDPDSFNLIDVRSTGEMAQGVIPGGEAMPLHLVPLRVEEIINSDKPVVMYCRSGARSAQAVMFVVSRGGNPDKIYNLRGGILDWVHQGNQVVAPNSGAMSA